MNDLDFIKFFLTRSNYENYIDLLDTALLSKEPLKLISSLKDLYARQPDLTSIEVGHFKHWFLQFELKQADQKELYNNIFSLLEARPNTSQDEILRGMAQKKAAAELMRLSGKQIDTELLRSIADTVDKASAKEDEIKACLLTKSLKETLKECSPTNGYVWNIDFLNEHMGRMPPKGMFLVVGGRPEACKTSFLVNTMGHFATQLQGGKILWFCNEGMTERLQNRLATSVLKRTPVQLKAASEAGYDVDQDYCVKLGGTNPFLIYEVSNRSVSFLERIIKIHKDEIKLIVVDMLDHIGLPKILNSVSSGNNDAMYGALYQWFLGVSIRYCSVIGTSQINKLDISVDPKHPRLEDLAQSKTLKQGAAQGLLMIGCEEGSDLRYLNIKKNKFGSGATDSYGVVKFDRQLCQFN